MTVRTGAGAGLATLPHPRPFVFLAGLVLALLVPAAGGSFHTTMQRKGPGLTPQHPPSVTRSSGRSPLEAAGANRRKESRQTFLYHLQ